MAKSNVLEIVEDPSAWTEWRPLSSLKSAGNYYPEQRVPGVYQICDSTPSEIVCQDIGYIGKSNNVEGRVWNVGAGVRGIPSSNHSCGKWLYSNEYNADNVYYRILFCSKEDITKAETTIHEKMQKLYGYRFKWLAAGENKLGRDFQLREQINDLSITSIVEDVLPMIERKIGREMLIAIINKEVQFKAVKD